MNFGAPPAARGGTGLSGWRGRGLREGAGLAGAELPAGVDENEAGGGATRARREWDGCGRGYAVRGQKVGVATRSGRGYAEIKGTRAGLRGGGRG